MTDQEITDKVIELKCYRGCQKFREAYSTYSQKEIHYLDICRECLEGKVRDKNE